MNVENVIILNHVTGIVHIIGVDLHSQNEDDIIEMILNDYGYDSGDIDWCISHAEHVLKVN